MPYDEEEAAKLSHSWAAGKTVDFAQRCEQLSLPEEEQIKRVMSLMEPVDFNSAMDDAQAHAIDGSCIEIPMSGGIPGASAMAVAVGGLDFSRAQLRETATGAGPVDPFAVANLLASGSGIGFLLPSRDLSYRSKSVSEGWALALDEMLFSESWQGIALSDALAFLSSIEEFAADSPSFDASMAELREGLGQGSRSFSLICPVCGERTRALISKADETGYPCRAKNCKTLLWASDALGVRGEFKLDAHSATLHAMLGLEKLFAAALLIRHGLLYKDELSQGAGRTIYLDGPLGHGALSKELKSLLIALRSGPNAFQRPWLVGIQKTGMLPRLASALGPQVSSRTMFAKADDDFLKAAFGSHASAAKRIAMEGAIGEPYVLVSQGKGYALWLPEGANKIANGTEVSKAMSMAAAMACWLYDNASLPNALAHRISSISVRPGRESISKIGSSQLKSGARNSLPSPG